MYSIGLTADCGKRDWGIQRILNANEMVMVSPITGQSPQPSNSEMVAGCWISPIREKNEDKTWFDRQWWPDANLKIEATVSRNSFEQAKQTAKQTLEHYMQTINLSHMTPLWDRLMDHQKTAVVWACRCFEIGHGPMLAMDTGTGKTLTTLAILDILRKGTGRELKCLAFGPKAGLGVWERDIDRFEIPCMQSVLVERKNIAEAMDLWKNSRNTLMLCTSYGNAVHKTGAFFEELSMLDNPDSVICDESHKIKSPKAKRTRRILSIGSRSRYNICMTATPVTKNVLDQGSQVEHLEFGQKRRDLVSARYWLCEKFLEENPRYYYNSTSVVDSMARADRGEFFYNVKKEDAIDLPGEIDVEIGAEWNLSPTTKRLYDNVSNALDIRNYDGFYDLSETVIKGTAREGLIQYTGKPIVYKGREVALNYIHLVSMMYRCSEIVNGILTVWRKDENGNYLRAPLDKSINDTINGDRLSERIVLWDAPKLQMLKSLLSYIETPVVVVGRYTTEMDIIGKLGRDNGLKCGEISGRIKDGVDHRTEMRKDLDLVAVSIGAGSESIDLTRASNVVYYGVGYDYAAYEQMRGRAYRIGQTRKVVHHILRTHNSMDDHVWSCMNRKENLVVVLEAETLGKKGR